MRRRAFWAATLMAAALLAGPAQAQAPGPAAPVAELCDALTSAGRAGGFAQRVAILSPVVRHSFALPTVLRAVVGPRYATVPAADQATLLDVFTQYTVASYAANFVLGPRDKLVVQPQTRQAGADQVVTTQIVPADGAPGRIDYQVRQGPAGWQVVDILLDGSISQAAVQRSDFRSLLAGGSVAPLVASLRAKTAALSAGGKG